MGYLALCTLLWLHTFVDRVWRNQLWRYGLRGLLGGRQLDWGEQIVVVTGGASGLGKQIVETLAIRHVTVVVLDLTKYVAEWDDVYSYECNVSKREEVFKVAERIREEVGEPTVLINNAGVVSGRDILDLTEEDIRRTLGVNTISHFWTLQAFLPAMKRRKTGHVVTIASILSYAGVAGLTDYCASKAALLGLHDSLRAELRSTPDIRLTLVAPGHMPTPLFAEARIPSLLARFAFPTVGPHTVCKTIVKALDAHESRDIYVPWAGQFAWLDRGVPRWLNDAVHWWAGVDVAFAPKAARERARKEE